MLLRADLLSYHETFGVVKVNADVDGETCAKGELTFSFIDIKNDKLQDSRAELYEICTKNTKVITSN
jgi:hypothetical protein